MVEGWDLVASRTGGTVAALASARDTEGRLVVFAATPAGLHRSDDGGRSWTPLGRASLPPPIETVAASPEFARDGTLFVGTPGGLYRSTDRGEEWQAVLVEARMLTVALSPAFGRDRLLFVGTETDGILRSDDGGRDWGGANPGLLDLTVMAVALSPRFESDRTAFAATASGLYRTRNGGRSWREVEVPASEPAVQCLAISPAFAGDRLALAGTEADGLLRSDDGGATWDSVAGLTSGAVTAIAFGPRYPAEPTLAVATGAGLALSRDGGETWQALGRDLGPVLSLVFAEDETGDWLLAGLPRQGVARLPIRAERANVAFANDGLLGSLLVQLSISPSFADDRTIFAAGLEDGVSVSRDGGTTWTPSNDGLDDLTVFGLIPSPRFAADRALYAATAAGLYRGPDGEVRWERLGSLDEGPVRAVAAGPAGTGGPVPLLAALPEGWLLLSEDDGRSWRRLEHLGGGAEVVALAFSPDYGRDRTLFAGAATAGPEAGLTLWLSTDNGRRWQRWLVSRGAGALPLAVSPEYRTDGLVLAGVGDRLLRPMRGAQEVRGGERRPIWQSAALPGGASITALALTTDFRRDGVVLAATNRGVCLSRDWGASFDDWSEGLEPGAIVALAVAPAETGHQVYALGLGGRVWRRVLGPE